MSGLRVQPISTSELQTGASVDGTKMNVSLEGTADLEAVDPLKKLLPELHEEAVRLGVDEVRLDLRKLEFMNSSCFKAFVTWLHQVKALDKEEQYRLSFLSSSTQRWQARSLYALQNFARELVTIESGGESE